MRIKTILMWVMWKYYTRKQRRQAKHVGKGGAVNFPSNFTNKTIVGDDCHFNGIKITGEGNVTIGNHFHCGRNVKIITSNHNWQNGKRLPYDDTYVHKDVVIGDNVWVGTDVIILGGSNIGEGAIIQAGSVVCVDVPELAIAGGHPARPFKYRNKEHYYGLKKKR